MKKEGVLLSFLAVSLLFLALVSAGSIDSQIQKLTHYAEEYETGNINYMQLLVYSSSIKANLNEEFGAIGKNEGGLLKAEQIKSILGEPTEETKWVWVEGEEQEKKLDSYLPVWRKIVFDGKKIQINLEANPSIFRKYNENEEIPEELKQLEGQIIYRLNFNIEFKKPQEQLDITTKIAEIKTFAEAFNSNPTDENAEALARESVNAEKSFESLFRQNPGRCEDIMNGVFGSENRRQMQNLIVNEIAFYEGKNFEAIFHLEMCDNCEWNWINLDLRLEGRAGFRQIKQEDIGRQSMTEFKNMPLDSLKAEAERILLEIKSSLESGDYSGAMNLANTLRVLNEAWNEKANNVWEEVEKSYKSKRETMTEQQRMEWDQNYGWIKEEQEKRQLVKSIMQKNYADRKQFYINFFSSYEKREFYFEQLEWEKRIVEEFVQFGEEICDNNQDDNANEQIDCADEQCGGKVCGMGLSTIANGTGIEVNYYCISETCQARQEIIEQKGSVCGNHICEGNETQENCKEDCSSCPTYPAIECSGKVIFKGKDENECPLEPICIEGQESCTANEDCMQPLCGLAECVKENPEDSFGKCEVKKLEECEEASCSDGENKIINCASGETIIKSICEAGAWVDVEGSSCPQETVTTLNEVIEEREAVGTECSVREDCGAENDVCSNGKCITIPEVIEPEPIQEPPQEQPPESSSTEPEQPAPEPPPSTEPPTAENSPEETQPPATASVILMFFRTLIGRITGNTITGRQTEEPSAETPSTTSDTGNSPEPPPETSSTEPSIEQPSDTTEQPQEPAPSYNQPPAGDQYREDDREQRTAEDRERCKKECVRPCVDRCIRQACGQLMDCNIDNERTKCESTCVAEDYCIGKCMQGGDWWREFQEQPKMEKGVFAVGGSCRKSQGKQEGFIWFNGWGDPFEKIQPLKNEYYQGGGADWCKWEIENLKRQRQEFESGFNQDFAKWFFEQYLANSAEEWEQSVSGIFEVYWKSVEIQMRTANVMQCLDKYDITEIFQPQLIEFKYDTEYGSVEYWEELKNVQMQGMDRSVKIVSPYMKIWVFPTQDFMKYEMRNAMENHEFPGPPEEKMERKNQEGLTEEEREMLKQDRKFMNMIKSISEKYNGNLSVAVKLMDYGKNESVFNLYVEVNDDVIMLMKPMPAEEFPEHEVNVEIDFAKIYDLILFTEKEMRGEERQFPPWDRKGFGEGFVKGIVDGISVRQKFKQVINSAVVYPESARKDVMNLVTNFFKMANSEGQKGQQGQNQEQEQTGEKADEIFGSKEEITGEIIGIIK